MKTRINLLEGKNSSRIKRAGIANHGNQSDSDGL